MFQKIKNFFKKVLDDGFQKAEISLNEPEVKKENNFEPSQIEIESEPVIKKTKRSLKYRK